MRGPGFSTGQVPVQGGGGSQLSLIDTAGLPGVVFDMTMALGAEMEDSASGYHAKINQDATYRDVGGMRMLYMRHATTMTSIAGPGNSPNIALLGAMTMCITYYHVDTDPTGSPVLAGVTATGESEATNTAFALDFDSTGRLEYFHESGSSGTNRVKIVEFEPPVGKGISLILARESDGMNFEIYDGGVSMVSSSVILPPTGSSGTEFRIAEIQGYVGQVVIANERWAASLCESVGKGVVGAA